MHIGKRLAIWRITEDAKAKDLAEKLGCTPAYVSAVEHGKKRMPVEWLLVLPEEFEAFWMQDAMRRAHQQIQELRNGKGRRLACDNEAEDSRREGGRKRTEGWAH